MAASDMMFRSPAAARHVLALALIPGLLWCSAHDFVLLLAAAALSLLLCAVHLPPLLGRLQERRAAACERLMAAQLPQLAVRCAAAPGGGGVYLGRGFAWQARHARALQEHLQRGLRQDAAGGRGGCCELHALERRNRRPLLLPLSALTGHAMIFGTTGTGKTTLLMLLICQAVARGETVIVIDPKGDRTLRTRIAQTARACGRGGDLLCLDVLGHDSAPFNPLSSFTDASEVGARLAQLLPQGGSAQSFRSYTEMALTASVSLLILQGRPVTFHQILTVIQDHSLFHSGALAWLKARIAQLDSTPARDYLSRLQGGRKAEGAAPAGAAARSTLPAVARLRELCGWLEKHELLERSCDLENVLAMAAMDGAFYQKVTASALPLLGTLCSSHLLQLLSGPGPSSSFADVIGQGRIFYTALHCLQNPGVGARLGRVMLADLASCAGRLYAAGQVPRARVDIFIDEASELVSENLVQLLNKARGVNFALTLATQTFADLVQRTGGRDGALQILGNCNTLFALRCADEATAGHVEHHLPTTACGRRSSAITLHDDEELGLREGISRSLHLEECPLFPAAALRLLPNLEFICRLADGRLLKGLLPLLLGNEEES